MKTPMRIVVLISGGGSNLQSIIDHCANGSIDAQIMAVISNRPEAFGLQRAHWAGITNHVVDHQRYDSREEFDNALRARIDDYQPELVVLAGFMRILTDEFINHYSGRMLNIHPSLLPEFRGLHTHQRALDAGVEHHGATVHFVTPELDGGPPVLQATVPVMPEDDAEALAARVLQEEHRIYPQVIEWFAAGRLHCDGVTVRLDGEPIGEPLSHNRHE